MLTLGLGRSSEHPPKSHRVARSTRRIAIVTVIGPEDVDRRSLGDRGAGETICLVPLVDGGGRLIIGTVGADEQRRIHI